MCRNCAAAPGTAFINSPGRDSTYRPIVSFLAPGAHVRSDVTPGPAASFGSGNAPPHLQADTTRTHEGLRSSGNGHSWATPPTGGGSYPVSPDNGIRQGAPSPVIVSSGPDRAGLHSSGVSQVRKLSPFLNFRCEGTAGHHHWRSPGIAIRVLGGGMYLRQSPGPFCPGPSFHMYKKQDHTGIGLVGIGRMGVLTNHLGSSITTSYLVHGFLGNL
jgi:hypothetical protein